MKKNFTLLISLLIAGMVYGQKADVNQFKPEFINWYNKDLAQDAVMGASVDRLYNEVLPNLKPGKTVVVAVIDGGVDVDHVDLKGKIWVNEDEIPGNGIDDDQNGYIDDIHGWNFLGAQSGEGVHFENVEYARIVRSKEGKDYAKAKEMYDLELAKRKKQKLNYSKFKSAWEKAKHVIKSNTGITVKDQEDLAEVKSNNENVIRAKQFLMKKFSQGVNEAMINNLLTNTNKYLNYHLNLDFNPRNLVGDDPLNFEDRNYGDNDVKGKRSDHGTSVAGVIAAHRNNDIGIDGIAENVKLMVLKSTPVGDERDKDVALAIIYAVDNGAQIINMSFSKEFSPQKEFVDKAVAYAEEKGVLLVHGAGNKGQNLDLNERFPSDIYLNGKIATNWLNVGATAMTLDKEIVGVFSNYGREHVGIFSPGVNIVSLDSTNTYRQTSGTSIAAPIVTGIAALILSYYPELTPQELIAILMESSYKVKKPKKVLVPNLKAEKREKGVFTDLSKSGGIVNAYNAFKYLESYSIAGKK